jgi:hypothetical protein
MAPGATEPSMAEKINKNTITTPDNSALNLLMDALKVAKSQAHRIPADLGLIKEVAKAALNNGLTDPKKLLVRFL